MNRRGLGLGIAPMLLARADQVMERRRGLLTRLYSCAPGIGLNLTPRNATPTGAVVDASMVMPVQIMFGEVAAMAIVP